jgi:Immunity protein 53
MSIDDFLASKPSVLDEIQSWFRDQCNGEWEVENRVYVESLDNPGWHVKVDIQGSSIENRQFEDLRIKRTKDNWVYCQIEEHFFHAYGGALNLPELLYIFLEWARQQESVTHGQ